MMELDGEPVTADRLAALALVNYGHFTSMMVNDLRVKGLRLHLDRLVRDCGLLFETSLNPDWVRYLLRRVASRTEGPTMLRATVFDPQTPRAGFTSTTDAGPSLLVSTRAAISGSPSGLRVRTVDYARDLPAVKHVGFFGPLRQRRLARLAGFDDALLMSGKATVCEGTTWNFGAQIGDELIWPDDECLPGVTRQLVQEVLDGLAIAWSSRSIERSELRVGAGGLRAAFATSAGIGVRPITAIDDDPVPGDSDLLEAIRAGYARIPAEPL
jgi:branched-subunit amino acid aminotransferase/4-amino-4-deoxychorismate lyase